MTGDDPIGQNKLILLLLFDIIKIAYQNRVEIKRVFKRYFLLFSDTKVHHRVSAMRPPCPRTNPVQRCITPFCKQPIFRETNIVNLDPIFKQSDTVNPDPIFRETDTMKTDRELFWKPSRFRFCVLYFLSILSEFLSREKLTQKISKAKS